RIVFFAINPISISRYYYKIDEKYDVINLCKFSHNGVKVKRLAKKVAKRAVPPPFILFLDLIKHLTPFQFIFELTKLRVFINFYKFNTCYTCKIFQVLTC